MSTHNSRLIHNDDDDDDDDDDDTTVDENGPMHHADSKKRANIASTKIRHGSWNTPA